jgi:hypothetical protein
MAKQSDASTKVVAPSHVAMLSHPKEVAAVMDQAASETIRATAASFFD